MQLSPIVTLCNVVVKLSPVVTLFSVVVKLSPIVTLCSVVVKLARKFGLQPLPDQECGLAVRS